MKHKWYKISVCAALAMTNLVAAPDAGTIQSDIEKNLAKTSPALNAPKGFQPVVEKQDAIKTVVKLFKFTGNTIVSTQELEVVVAPYIGKELGFNSLQKVVAEVSDYYAAKGGLAKVYLPKQEISGGVVTIAIIEGKLNSVIIDNKEARLSTRQAERYIYAQNQKGTPIKNKELSTALMNLNDIGGLKATSSLAPGEAQGSSDLVVKLKDGAKYSADVGVDNFGSKATGLNELSAGLSVNNVSNSDKYDNLNIRTMTTSGVRFVRVGYTLPVGYNGDKVGISQSAMTYRLVNGDIDADGYSTTTALNWAHPFVKTAPFSVTLNNELAYKRFNNIVSGTPSSNKKMTVLNSTLAVSKADTYWGGGVNTVSAGITLGKLDLKDNVTNYTNDQTTANTNGNYIKYAVNASRQQYVSEKMTLQGSFQAQTSNKNLDSSEELSLGGAYGVRAYPTSEARGDSGYLANLELRYTLTNELTPSLFTDYGRVYINKNKWSGSGNNSDTIGGYGVGLNYTTSTNLNIKGQIARRLSTGYNPNDNETNSDGSKSSETRYWVNASYFF